MLCIGKKDRNLSINMMMGAAITRRKLGAILSAGVGGVSMLYFDGKTKQAIDINVKKIIIYLIDIKTDKLFSEN